MKARNNVKTFTLYTYDLWAESNSCSECGKETIELTCCDGAEINTSYTVNDVYKCESFYAETIEQAEKLFKLKMDMIEPDFESEKTSYYRYKQGKFNGSPACEIRIIEKE